MRLGIQTDTLDRNTCGRFGNETYKKLAQPQENGGAPGYTGGFSGGGGGGGGGNTMIAGDYEKKEEETSALKPIKADFTDIEGVDWAVEAILALADKGVIHGVEPGVFKPNQNVTREEFVKILLGAMGLGNEKAKADAFSDVEETDWFYHWVNLATERRIVNGVGNGMFGAGQNITRQDMSVMICNALTYAGNTLQAGEFVFDDNDAIADYAKSSVSALYALGAVKGKTETTFEPTSFATRAEAAKMIYGVWNLLDL